jgi:hypothetical protein
MCPSGRLSAIFQPTSGTLSKKGFTPNSWASWKRCWRLAMSISACAGAQKKVGQMSKTVYKDQPCFFNHVLRTRWFHRGLNDDRSQRDFATRYYGAGGEEREVNDAIGGRHLCDPK